MRALYIPHKAWYRVARRYFIQFIVSEKQYVFYDLLYWRYIACNGNNVSSNPLLVTRVDIEVGPVFWRIGRIFVAHLPFAAFW